MVQGHPWHFQKFAYDSKSFRNLCMESYTHNSGYFSDLIKCILSSEECACSLCREQLSQLQSQLAQKENADPRQNNSGAVEELKKQTAAKVRAELVHACCSAKTSCFRTVLLEGNGCWHALYYR